jgi:hypothetical protein
VRVTAAGALLAVLLAGPATASAQREPKPRLDAGRVAAEAIGGSYAGIGGFLLGRYVGNEVGEALGVRSDVTRNRVGYATGAVVGTFATAGFVYAIGNLGDQAGDFDDTLMGASAGLVVGYALSKILFANGAPRTGTSSAARWAAINVIALMPSVGATIAFNSTRRTQ